MNERKRKTNRRLPGTGCLVNRNGIWYARWTHHGRVHFVSTGYRAGDTVTMPDGSTVPSRKAADAFLLDRTEHIRIRRREDAIAQLIRQLQRPSERLADDLDRIRRQPTVGELSERFASSPRRPDCSEAMLAYYRRVSDAMAESVGKDTPVCDIDQRTADSYASKIRKTLAPSTFNKAVNALALVWRVCARECGALPDDNPWTEITRRRLDTHVRRAFTEDETDRILGTATGELRVLVAVMLYTGLRLGDACLFRREDIRDGAAYVTTAKTGAKVAIPIHPKLAEILGDGPAAGYVCPETARRYSEDRQGHSNVSRSVKRLIERCGIATSFVDPSGRKRPDATAHSFRHTFVSRALAAGVPTHVVQAIVGHTTFAMTDHYNHLSDATVLDAFSRIAR